MLKMIIGFGILEQNLSAIFDENEFELIPSWSKFDQLIGMKNKVLRFFLVGQCENEGSGEKIKLVQVTFALVGMEFPVYAYQRANDSANRCQKRETRREEKREKREG